MRNDPQLSKEAHEYTELTTWWLVMNNAKTPLDKPLVPEDFPDPKANEASRSRTEVIVGFVKEQRPTLRQLLASWVVHDLGHLAQVARVMAKQYGAEVGPWVPFLPVLTDHPVPRS